MRLMKRCQNKTPASLPNCTNQANLTKQTLRPHHDGNEHFYLPTALREAIAQEKGRLQHTDASSGQHGMRV
jgi:hypothetical protein